MFQDDFLLNVALGKVPGYKAENKFGRNIEIDNAVTADVWDGGHTVASGGTSLIWLAPTAARIHTISSDNAADDDGGIGANSVNIYYLPDWDTLEQMENVTGDLDAGIVMENAAVIIHRMEVVPQATSTSANVGTIIATAATDTTVTARIRPGQGQTQMAVYGIPSTQTAYVHWFYISANNLGGVSGSAEANLLVNPCPNVQTLTYITKHTFGLKFAGSSANDRQFKAYKKIAGPAIIKAQMASTVANSDVSAGFDLILVNNDI